MSENMMTCKACNKPFDADYEQKDIITLYDEDGFESEWIQKTSYAICPHCGAIEKDGKVLKPFKVTIKETLARTAIVYAEDQFEAEEKANEGAGEGKIELNWEDFDERQVSSDKVENAFDIEYYQRFV